MILNPDDPIEEADVGELGELVETYTQEYSNLDSTIDEISSYMDKLEQRTDTLYTELQELLKNNQQARLEMQMERLATSNQDKPVGDTGENSDKTSLVTITRQACWRYEKNSAAQQDEQKSEGLDETENK